MALMQEIKDRSAEFFKLSHHDGSHSERVRNIALMIGKEEGADLEVVEAAALLHDVARSMEDRGNISDHAEEGARIAHTILKESGFPKEKMGLVCRCIQVHRFRNGMFAESPEAKVLQDADRLDVIGAIGIARLFTRSGWENIPIHDPMIPPKEKYDGKSLTSVNHIYEKVLRIKETLHTASARRIAEDRHGFIEQFLKRLLMEWSGEI
ncbi:MAG TPA: HD domain-containing protein [Candidatus Bathyarchaeia archaeon]|nr:HD domain-containing protein [Candidatus Bathyarchaeia archaeon]